jgi:integrase
MAPRPAEASTEVPARPSLEELRAVVDNAADRSHSDNTKATYRWSLNALTTFCAGYGISPVMPCSAVTLGDWAAAQMVAGKSPNTILTRARAIRSIHRRPQLAGLTPPAEPWPVPELVVVENVVRMHRRDLADRGWVPNEAAALLMSDLRRIRAHMGDFRRGIDVRDWCILILGFAMGARRSELSCLNIEDIALDPDDDQFMMVRICSSKTDQEGRGTIVRIPRAREHALCPVRATFDLIMWLKMRKITTGPLLRQMCGRGDKLQTAAESKGDNAAERSRLSGQAVSRVYSARSLAAEIPGYAGRLKRHTGHSGRKGAATELARAGATSEEVCEHLRWKKGSEMAAHYVEAAALKADHPMTRVM